MTDSKLAKQAALPRRPLFRDEITQKIAKRATQKAKKRKAKRK